MEINMENQTDDKVKLTVDEAIDDMEAGRVLTEEELWAEIDAI